MSAAFAVADVAALIGEPTRAAMLIALLDGRELPASDLAKAAHLSPAATSLHLAKLVQGGLLVARKEGRHRYYGLASHDVAHALEALGLVSTRPPPAAAERTPLRNARTCYDHLAGVLSVALTERLRVSRRLVAREDRTFEITDEGGRWFATELAIDVGALAHGKRTLARQCLDWTERRPHVAGALGAAMLDTFLTRRWVARAKDTRALRITTVGQQALEALVRDQ